MRGERGGGLNCAGPLYGVGTALTLAAVAAVFNYVHPPAGKRTWFITGVLVIYPALLLMVFEGILHDYVLRKSPPNWVPKFCSIQFTKFASLTMLSYALISGAVRFLLRRLQPKPSDDRESREGQLPDGLRESLTRTSTPRRE